MRKLCCVVLALGVALALAGQTNADDPADARAIIDKAINALGGKDKLAQLKAQTWSESGTYYGQGKGLPYTGKYALQFPNQFRMEIEGVFTMVVNGDQGWLKSEKGTEEMTVLIEDLIKLLDGLSNTYHRGKHPDNKEAKKIAAVLRAVADDIEP